ncbi:MAG: hypothetical protein ACOC9E_04880 [Chloroflexota bacterium]
MESRARWPSALWSVFFLLPLLLSACARSDQRTPTAPAVELESSETAESEATATPLSLPTLLPSATAVIVPATNVTSTPAPTPSPQRTVDFEQPVVEFRYTIPSLQLDRRLEGDVSGQVTVVDETRGVAAIRQNQGGVLLELQGVLPALEPEPLPPDCETCVAFSYELPLEDAEGEGWLQDPVLLASVENYTAALLGPHFPPDTILGLRRSATAYDVAHTLALDENGILYRWLATAGEVDEPAPVGDLAPELPQLVAELERDELQDQYVMDCVSAPVETLYIRPAEADVEGEQDGSISLSCPAFSLPWSLLPLYTRLNALLEETLEGSGIPRPPSEVALDAVLDYRNEVGTHLVLRFDGVAQIEDDAGEAVTTTLGITDVISITDSLLESGELQPELANFVEGDFTNILLVRGEQGMMEVAWQEDDVPQEIADEVEILEGLIDGDDEGLEIGD